MSTFSYRPGDRVWFKHAGERRCFKAKVRAVWSKENEQFVVKMKLGGTYVCREDQLAPR